MKDTMLAAVVTPERTLEVRSVPIPDFGPYEALVAMRFGATCAGTDQRVIDHGHPRPLRYPGILGHESVGRVIAVGEKATSFAVGDLITRVGAPETEDLVYYLEPGQYYLRVDGTSDSDGDYRVKVALEPCACDEIEGNDDYHGAQSLPSGETLAGVLTEWDEYDYYTFTLDAETQVHLTANDESDGQCVLTLYDGDMVEQATIYDLHGYAEDRTLSAGTYYLAISNAKGAYTLKAIY